MDYMRAERRLSAEVRLPPAAVILLDESLPGQAAQRYGAKLVCDLHGQAFILDKVKPPVALLTGFGIGAPALATYLEEMITLGARRFIAVGTAGGLREGMKAGDLILCSKAIRDEGTSHHYLCPSLWVAPSTSLSLRLRRQFTRHQVSFSEGATWTTDAPYRESCREVRHYRSLGVVTVEMEAAALFAVAKCRRVQAAAAFSISDVLSDSSWDQHFRSLEAEAGLDTLLDLAIRALRTSSCFTVAESDEE